MNEPGEVTSVLVLPFDPSSIECRVANAFASRFITAGFLNEVTVRYMKVAVAAFDHRRVMERSLVLHQRRLPEVRLNRRPE